MNVPLPNPISVAEKIEQITQRSSASVEFMMADFVAGRVVVKLQPWNREVVIEGAQYEAMRSAFEAGLAAAVAPAVAAALNPPEVVAE